MELLTAFMLIDGFAFEIIGTIMMVSKHFPRITDVYEKVSDSISRNNSAFFKHYTESPTQSNLQHYIDTSHSGAATLAMLRIEEDAKQRKFKALSGTTFFVFGVELQCIATLIQVLV